MDCDADEMYGFVCPDCAESLEVNRAMRDALIRNGCVICGVSVTPAAFTDVDSVE